jgi:hypothetical protein
VIHPRFYFAAIAVAFLLIVVIASWAPGGEPSPLDTATGPEPPPAPPAPTTTSVGTLVNPIESARENALRRENRRLRRKLSSSRSSVAGLRRTLLHRPNVVEAINLSCVVYGSCSTLWRKAKCESRLRSGAVNSSSGAAGLFQFLWSTWRRTPFARFSPFSAIANALAAGWMHLVGRGREWVCQ